MGISFGRFGTAKAIASATATLLFTGTTGHLYTCRLFLNGDNLSYGQGSLLYVWVAANGWASGDPAGATLVDTIINGEFIDGPMSGPTFMVSGTQKVVIKHVSVTGSLNLHANLFGTDYI